MDFLKDVLGEELYTQVEGKLTAYNSNAGDKSKEIKLANLSSGEYVSKDKYTALETEASGYKAQLEEAGKQIKSYQGMDIEGIKKAAAEWETKYNEDTGKLKETLARQEKEFAAREYLGKQGFKSELAKKAALTELMNQNLDYEDGTFSGADDFIKKLKASDPDAFLPEKKEEPEKKWVKGTGNSYHPTASSEEEAYLKQKYGNNKYYKGK